MSDDSQWQDLAPMKAMGKLRSARIVDVREVEEFSSPIGHVVGSQNVPLSALLEQTEDWDRDAPLLVICRYGHKSRVACQKLAGEGFTQLYNLEGGLLAWLGAGLPTN